MHRELRQRIKEATEKSGINKLDFIELLKLIDEHYDKMEASISESLTTQTLTIPSTTAMHDIDRAIQATARAPSLTV